MPQTIAVQDLALADHIRPGETLCWGQAAAEPLTLTETLMRQRQELGGVKAFVGISWSETTDPAHADAIQFMSYCGTGRNRLLHRAGQLDILPIHYSQFETSLAGRVDVLFLQLAPGRIPGTFSFGLACEYLWPLIRSARLVIAEVNDQVPPTPASVEVRPGDIDIIVPTSRPVPAPADAPATDIHRAIASHIAEIVPDGACLQIGLGTLPAAILESLDGHRHLGVHTGLFVDGLARLIESGVIDNSQKPIDTGVSVAGLIAGTEVTHRMCRDTEFVRLAPATYTHSLPVLAQIGRFTSINSALEVDLTGQANAERAGQSYIGAVGGGTDFSRGAAAAHDGLPIIALPSARKARDGSLISSIVASLKGPVSIARADAGILVTEYGMADLRGLTLEERKKQMIRITHPDLRDAIAKQAE